MIFGSFGECVLYHRDSRTADNRNKKKKPQMYIAQPPAATKRKTTDAPGAAAGRNPKSMNHRAHKNHREK